MVENDGPFQPPARLSGPLGESPQLVCLDCGKALFGPIVKPFNLIDNEECEICATVTQVVHVSIFRDREDLFSRR